MKNCYNSIISSHILFSSENSKNKNSYLTQYKKELNKLLKSKQSILEDIDRLKNLFIITSKIVKSVDFKELEKNIIVVQKIDEDLQIARNLLKQASSRFTDKPLITSISNLIEELKSSKKEVDKIIRQSTKLQKPRILSDNNPLIKFIINSIKRSIALSKDKNITIGKDYFTSTKTKDGKIKFLRVFPIFNLGDIKKCFVILYSELDSASQNFNEIKLVFSLSNPIANSTGGYIIKNKKDVTSSLRHLGYSNKIPLFNNLVKINPEIKLERRTNLRVLSNPKVKIKIKDDKLLLGVPNSEKLNFSDIFLDVKELLNITTKNSGLKYTSKPKDDMIIYTFTLVPNVNKELNENAITDAIKKL